MTVRTFPLLATLLLVTMIVAGLIGGIQFPFDLRTDMWFIGWRAEHVQLTRAIIAFTQLGGSAVLVPLGLLVTTWLWFRRQRRNALLFIGTALSGRAMIEIIKLLVDRPRPAFDPHPVLVASKSFPSGHAGNSTLTYLSIALYAVPERWRKEAMVAAMTLAVAIGCTRPILGVHWPTDVLAGWSFGLFWVGMWWWLSQRGGRAASGYLPASSAAEPD